MQCLTYIELIKYIPQNVLAVPIAVVVSGFSAVYLVCPWFNKIVQSMGTNLDFLSFFD